MPLSDFTTPCSAICSMSRHFLPVLHPEPIVRFTTGLTKGSRFPVMAYFLSSGLSALAVFSPAPLPLAAAGAALAAAFGAAAAFTVTGALGAVGLFPEMVTGLAGCAGLGAACGGVETGFTAGTVCGAGAGLLATAPEGLAGAVPCSAALPVVACC